MVHNANLVIIGISVGLAVGIFVASIVFIGICWYKKRANLRQCATDHSAATLPIRTNGLGTSIDSSVSLSSSVNINRSVYLAPKPRYSWWNNHRKDHFAFASGILRYSYKHRHSEGDKQLHSYSGTGFIWLGV